MDGAVLLDQDIDAMSAKARAIHALKLGEAIVVSGSTRGAFMMMSAHLATPYWVNFMATHARGLLGITLSHRQAMDLGLSLQTRRGRSDRPHYTQSIEARQGVTTGISAKDRWLTIAAACTGHANDVVSPGHVFPQLTEGNPDAHADIAQMLLQKAGLAHTAMVCSIIDDRGALPSTSYLRKLGRELSLEHLALA